MIRVTNIAFVAMLLLHCALAEESKWMWGNEAESQTKDQLGQSQSQGDELQFSASDAIFNVLNDTEADKIVDGILDSGRQGKALDGFDELYSDPSVQEAIQKGDDGEARNIIKDRLCLLGLIQCDENVQGKRPFISPEDLQYAQPVAINPIGRPIPTIPLKGVRGSYGPPKPVPFPPGPGISAGNYGPPNRFRPPGIIAPNKPPRRGYGPPPPPSFNKPFHGPPSKPFNSGPGSDIIEGAEYFSRPSYTLPIEDVDRPYHFEHGSVQKDKRVEVVVNAHGGGSQTTGPALTASGPQQHVHHHFHHNLNGDNSEHKQPTVIVKPVPVPVASAAAAVSSTLHSSNGFYESSSLRPGLWGSTSGFSPVAGAGGLTIGNGGFGTDSYGGQTIANYGSSTGSFGVKPIHESHNEFGSNGFGLGNFGSNSFGTSVGSYGSSGLYKKELNLNSLNNNYIQSNYADKYHGVESTRNENYDCVCVPYDQCPTSDIIGRKDDLYLPLDPRSLKSDIEAIEDEERVLTDANGTMTVVRIPKNTALNLTEFEQSSSSEQAKKISKRETSANDKQSENEGEDEERKVEPRQYGAVAGMLGNKKITPTFGISFGLPHQGGFGYPINPYGPHPHPNPYGGALGAQGINLGLISVNPLVSVQVTKDDYGAKVVKPFVNLHITPNDYLLHKFEDIISYKKDLIHNKHHHLHYHKGHHYHKKPHHYHHHHQPIYSASPVVYSEPLHSPPSHGPPGPIFVDSEIYSGYESPKPTFSHYDDIPTYAGGFSAGYDDTLYGRAYNLSELVAGNDIISQYKQYYDSLKDYMHQFGIKGLDRYNVGTLVAKQDNRDTLVDSDSHYAEQQRSEQSYRPSSYSRRGKTLPISTSNIIKFPSDRRRRDLTDDSNFIRFETERQAHYGIGRPTTCGPRHVCCRRPYRPQVPNQLRHQCGKRHSQGINGRIKNPVYVDGDSEFGEYPWQVAILKKDPKESVYVCGGTLIDHLHIVTAAHCVKQYSGLELRVRLGEWDVNHDVEFYPYIERDVASVNVHPEFYAGTLYNDIALLRMDKPVDFAKHPHISPACLPSLHDDYTGARCWTTGWGKDAFGDFGKYQNILKEVDVPVIGHSQCQRQLQQTRLGYDFQLHRGFICAGGEEGKDACKGDGGGPMVCERGDTWQIVGVVSWGIGCGQFGVPGVYVKVAHYLDWIRQITQRY